MQMSLCYLICDKMKYCVHDDIEHLIQKDKERMI